MVNTSHMIYNSKSEYFISATVKCVLTSAPRSAHELVQLVHTTTALITNLFIALSVWPAV